MSKNSFLLKLRIKLDEAITYGTKKEAGKLARQGLKEAQDKNLLGEIAYFKGQSEILKENFASAINYFDAAIKYNLHDGAAYNDRALCMVELGIIDEAFYYFDKGIAVEPDYATVYHNKGWLLNNLGRYGEAITCFQKALDLEPRRAVTYDNLADALFNLEDYPGALAAYKEVLRFLRPGSCRQIKKEIQSKIKSLQEILAKEDHAA